MYLPTNASEHGMGRRYLPLLCLCHPAPMQAVWMLGGSGTSGEGHISFSDGFLGSKTSCRQRYQPILEVKGMSICIWVCVCHTSSSAASLSSQKGFADHLGSGLGVIIGQTLCHFFPGSPLSELGARSSCLGTELPLVLLFKLILDFKTKKKKGTE